MVQTTGQKFTVKHESGLLQYLFEIFPGQSKTGVKTTLRSGQVTVNGSATTAFDHPLKAGDTIVILPKGISIAREVKETARELVENEGIHIIYEDDDIIVVDKPSGLPTISTGKSQGEKTLYAHLNAYVKTKARAQRKENLIARLPVDRRTARVWIVHRLDRGTSGLLVLAKSEQAKNVLQSRWKELVIERIYTAFVEGEVTQESGAVQSWLTESPKSLKMHSSLVEVKDGQLAITHFRTISYVTRGKSGRVLYTKMEFQLQTGRKNQIRVHAADLGHPIAGDDKYGAETDPIRRLALHASTLVFRHPFKNEVLRFKSPLPDEFKRLG